MLTWAQSSAPTQHNFTLRPSMDETLICGACVTGHPPRVAVCSSSLSCGPKRSTLSPSTVVTNPRIARLGNP
jgi:hypothetical protein